MLAFLPAFEPDSSAAGERFERLDSLLEPIREEFDLPALAASVIVCGDVRGAGAVGVRRRPGGREVTVLDRFLIGSCTKSMTATLAAALVEGGVLSWDTTVGEALGDLEPHEDFRPVTLKQLLRHRGGLPGRLSLSLRRKAFGGAGGPREGRRHYASVVLERAPEYVPGEKHLYSNAGYIVAGAVLEAAAGRSWESLMEARLFAPLRMAGAGFGAPNALGAEAQPWGHLPGGKPVPPGPASESPVETAPSGGVHASVIDLAKYVRMHLRRRGPVLKQLETFDTLHSVAGRGRGYAMGWVVVRRPWSEGEVLTHAGSNTMFYSVLWLAPAEEFGAVIVTNIGVTGGREACDAAASALVRRYLP